VERAAELLGLGTRSLRAIPVDEAHRLVPAELEHAIALDVAAGATPIAVVANAGTTLTGAVDPLAAIADICARHGVWLHVDGAYGLPAAATPSHGYLFDGLAQADSVALDAHKWLYLPKACSAFLVRDPSALTDAFAHEAEYMPHEHAELHAVDQTIEYSRPFRALKLWLAFRVHGAQAFRDAVEANLEEARLLADIVRAAPDLELALEPQLSVVPFRHRPNGVGDLDAHNRLLAGQLLADGRVYVAGAVIGGHQWLRPCLVNYRTTSDDVRALVDIVREVGDRVASASSS
jgi:aromatic-L-amino-acid decarboxylase